MTSKKQRSGESDNDISKNMLEINGLEFNEDNYNSVGPARRNY